MKRWFLRIERDGFVGLEREEEREREIWGGVAMGDGEEKEREIRF